MLSAMTIPFGSASICRRAARFGVSGYPQAHEDDAERVVRAGLAPNVSSGGRPTDIDVGRFLVHDTHGPEHRELLRLIGTLAQVDPE